MTPTISKSQYLRGLQCNKALWLSRNRKDLQLEPSPAKKDILDTGNLIGKLAMDNYPAGVEVTNEYWDINGAIKAFSFLYKPGDIKPQRSITKYGTDISNAE